MVPDLFPQAEKDRQLEGRLMAHFAIFHVADLSEGRGRVVLIITLQTI